MTLTLLALSCGCVQAHDHFHACEWHGRMFVLWLGQYPDDVRPCPECDDVDPNDVDPAETAICELIRMKKDLT